MSSQKERKHTPKDSMASLVRDLVIQLRNNSTTVMDIDKDNIFHMMGIDEKSS